MRIPSEIDMEALRTSIDILSKRHASLRTNFRSNNGQPEQVIHDHPQKILHEFDVTGKSEQEIKVMMREYIDRPFDLENDPLTRIVIFTKAPNEHVFLFVGHHIISDMWSLALFMFELDILYRGGGQAELKPIDFTYVDFARQQNKKCRGRGSNP